MNRTFYQTPYPYPFRVLLQNLNITLLHFIWWFWLSPSENQNNSDPTKKTNKMPMSIHLSPVFVWFLWSFPIFALGTCPFALAKAASRVPGSCYSCDCIWFLMVRLMPKSLTKKNPLKNPFNPALCCLELYQLEFLKIKVWGHMFHLKT